MARINWKQRFAALLAQPRLQGRDRAFIESLHGAYSKGKGMSSGRRQWFLKIEDFYSREVVTDEAMIALVENTMDRTIAINICKLQPIGVQNGPRIRRKGS